MQAAVLHDTVEDTNTTLEEIEQLFGQEVRSLVDEVSDDKSLPKEERKRLQVCVYAHIIELSVVLMSFGVELNSICHWAGSFRKHINHKRSLL